MELAELAQLVEQYGDVLYAFCNQLTGSRQEGEELYQETFLKAVELHRQIDTAQNPKGFLIAVAARLWRNRQRKYAWRQRIAPVGQLTEQEKLQPMRYAVIARKNWLYGESSSKRSDRRFRSCRINGSCQYICIIPRVFL